VNTLTLTELKQMYEQQFLYESFILYTLSDLMLRVVRIYGSSCFVQTPLLPVATNLPKYSPGIGNSKMHCSDCWGLPNSCWTLL